MFWLAALVAAALLLFVPAEAAAAPPAPTFTTSPSPQAGQPVTFTASATGATDYVWDFGDGSPSESSASPVQHTYSYGGGYTVTVTALDTSGTTSQTTQQIGVIGPPPPAVQTLVESIIPAPILVKFGSPSILRPGIIDLHWRLFCPGSGPVCRTTIAERNGVTGHRKAAARAAAATVLVTKPNGNAELALQLTSAQWEALGKSHHLSFSLSIVSTRGAEKVTNFLRFNLTRRG